MSVHASPSERYNNLGNRFSLKGAVLGQALADVVSELIATEDADRQDECAAQALHYLNELLVLAAPALERERLMAARGLPKGQEINRWSLEDIERDPDLMMVARFVVADIHERLSNLLPEHWALGLSIALRELNRGAVKLFAVPRKGRKGASFDAQIAKEQLGQLFWLRHRGGDLTATVEHFAEVTGLDVRTIYEAARKVSEHDRKIFQEFAAQEAAGPVAMPSGGRPPPPLTDQTIAAVGKRIKRHSRKKVSKR